MFSRTPTTPFALGFQHAFRSIAGRSIAGLVMLAACLCGLCGSLDGEPVASAARNEEPLRFGETLKRQIAGGQQHQWRASIAAGQYAQIVFTVHDVRLTGHVTDPDGATVLEAPLWHAQIGGRYYSILSFIAEKTGAFTVELKAAGAEAEAGQYEIKAEEPRLAVEEDRRRISAHRLWGMGLKLREPQTTDARRAAVAQYEEALGVFTQIGDRYAQALTLNTIADIWYDLANAQKIFETHDKALKLWQTLGHAREEGATLSELGLAAYLRYDYPKAMDFYRAALEKHRATGDVFSEADTLNRMGWCDNAQGEKRKALVLYEQALKLRRAARNREGESITLNDIGRAYMDLGDIPEALEAYQQALRLRPPVRDPRGAINILNRIGIAHSRAAGWQKALDTYRQTLALARQVNDKRTEAAVLNNMGTLFDKLRDTAGALEHYEQGLKAARESGLRNGEASVLQGIGTSFINAGEYQKGIESLQQALEIFRAIQDGANEASVLENLGAAYQLQGEYQRALETLQQALAKIQALGGNHREAGVLTWLATSHALLGDRPKALEVYDRALNLHRKNRNRIGEADTLLLLGRSHGEAGAFAEARARVEESLDITEPLRNQTIGHEVRTLSQSYLSDRYKLLVDVLMASERATPGAGFAAQAFQTSERARARNLLEMLAEANADIRAGIDPKLLATERELQMRRNVKGEALTTLLAGKHTPEQAAALAQEITDITNQLSEVEVKIRAISPRYAALTQPVPLTTAEIQRQVLDDDTALLEYSLDGKRSYLWVVTKEAVHGFTLPGSAEITAAARRFLDLLPQGKQRKYQRETELAAEALSRLILQPAAQHLSKKRLVIVADGPLQYVPFAALPKPVVSGQWPVAGGNANQPSAANRQPLIKEHELVSLPSASTLAVLRNELKGRPPAAKQLAIFSDPVFQAGDARVQLAKANRAAVEVIAGSEAFASRNLERAAAETGFTDFERLPFARQEAEAIAKLIPREQQLKALDFAASRETALAGKLDQYRIVHFATHGLLNSRHPDLSGIVLSRVDETGQPRDGFLRLGDLYNLKLNADLVVLSACRTALGKDVRGEGLIGLTRGFMYAGAARVVASLWNVNDAATAELMRKFYRAMLVEKQTPAAALRTAQLAMARDARWSAPYYWAGFVLQGEWK